MGRAAKSRRFGDRLDQRAADAASAMIGMHREFAYPFHPAQSLCEREAGRLVEGPRRDQCPATLQGGAILLRRHRTGRGKRGIAVIGKQPASRRLDPDQPLDLVGPGGADPPVRGQRARGQAS